MDQLAYTLALEAKRGLQEQMPKAIRDRLENRISILEQQLDELQNKYDALLKEYHDFRTKSIAEKQKLLDELRMLRIMYFTLAAVVYIGMWFTTTNEDSVFTNPVEVGDLVLLADGGNGVVIPEDEYRDFCIYYADKYSNDMLSSSGLRGVDRLNLANAIESIKK